MSWFPTDTASVRVAGSWLLLPDRIPAAHGGPHGHD